MPPSPHPSSTASPDTKVAEPFERSFGGVLLDLDGTLIDSIPAVVRSWLRWCGEYEVDPARLTGFHGMTAVNVIADLLPEERRAEAFARIREIEVADVEGIVLLPGAAELLAALADGGVPTGIVTSGTSDLAEARIAATGLTRPVALVTASDVERGKPWPDPWLEGARRLGVAPADCVVVEDAVAGLRAARAARCGALVAVLGTTPLDELVPEADLVVSDLTHLTASIDGGRVHVRGDRA